MPTVLKTVVPQGTVSSNLTLSAKFVHPPRARPTVSSEKNPQLGTENSFSKENVRGSTLTGCTKAKRGEGKHGTEEASDTCLILFARILRPAG